MEKGSIDEVACETEFKIVKQGEPCNLFTLPPEENGDKQHRVRQNIRYLGVCRFRSNFVH